MKKKEKEEVPLAVVERNLWLLAGSVIVSVALVYSGYKLLKDVNGWAFILLVPGITLTFQSLLWLLNPYAEIYKTRLEIRQSMFSHKEYFFIDIVSVTESKGRLYITYRDGEVAPLALFGIRPSQVSLLKKEIETMVSQTVLAE